MSAYLDWEGFMHIRAVDVVGADTVVATLTSDEVRWVHLCLAAVLLAYDHERRRSANGINGRCRYSARRRADLSGSCEVPLSCGTRCHLLLLVMFDRLTQTACAP